MIWGAVLKEQYIGDVSDYRKYALLRLLSELANIRITVAWMLTSPDDRTDGNKRQYLGQPNLWRYFDPSLYDEISEIMDRKTDPKIEDVEALQSLKFLNFFNKNIEDKHQARIEYFDQLKIFSSKSDLVFFDPDNGLEIKSIRKGKKNSSKYLYKDELIDFYDCGHSILLYQHYPRIARSSFENCLCVELAALCDQAVIWVFKTSHVLFLLMVHPSHAEKFDKFHNKLENKSSDFLFSSHKFCEKI